MWPAVTSGSKHNTSFLAEAHQQSCRSWAFSDMSQVFTGCSCTLGFPLTRLDSGSLTQSHISELTCGCTEESLYLECECLSKTSRDKGNRSVWEIYKRLKLMKTVLFFFFFLTWSVFWDVLIQQHQISLRLALGERRWMLVFSRNRPKTALPDIWALQNSKLWPSHTESVTS